MRLVLQRVTQASVAIEKKIHASIQDGLLVLIGIEDHDNDEDIQWVGNKLLNLRIFNDSNQVMNLSVLDIHGELLIISQFTLFASTRKGNRPSYIKASKPEIAIPLYEKFINYLKNNCQLSVKSGIFGANMQISLINDGPVTIIIDSKIKK